MKTYRTPIAAALCCMALASGAAFAQSSTSGSDASSNTSTMNRGAAPSGMGMGAGAGMPHMNAETVRQVQQALQSKGHNPGPIDGMMGPRTRSALQAYQRSNNLTGARGLDQQTMSSLGVQASSGAMGTGDSASSAGGSGSTMGGAGGTATRRNTESGTPGTGSPSSRTDGGTSGATTGGTTGSTGAK